MKIKTKRVLITKPHTTKPELIAEHNLERAAKLFHHTPDSTKPSTKFPVNLRRAIGTRKKAAVQSATLVKGATRTSRLSLNEIDAGSEMNNLTCVESDR